MILAFACLGPVFLPALMRINFPRTRKLGIWSITNLITLLPMVAMTLWLRAYPDPSCLVVNPDAACDGIPTSAAWFFYAVASGLLVIWGILASMAATAFVFRKD